MLKRNNFYVLSVIFSLFLFLSACGTGAENEESTNTDDGQAEQETQTNGEASYPIPDENPIVTITMENDEEIVLELYPEIAPNTVANFVSLVEEGFYDGTIFHRVIPGFMIQGGDPEGIGTGGPGYGIPGEFSSNGFENTLTHDRGVMSMARAMDPNSAGSQFFIMVENTPDLDGDYAAFGKVLEGMETVDKIVAAERNENDKPLEDQKMKSVVVDTKGYDYPEPQKTK